MLWEEVAEGEWGTDEDVNFKGFWIKSMRELLLYCVISQLETAYGCVAAIMLSQLLFRI